MISQPRVTFNKKTSACGLVIGQSLSLIHILKAAQGKDNVHIYVTTFYQEGGNAGAGPYGREAELAELVTGDLVQLGGEDGRYYHTVSYTHLGRI